MRVPLRFFSSKFAQTYSLTSRAYWLKKPCSARMSKGSKPPRKISFRLLLPQKKENGVSKDSPTKPKERCAKQNKKYMGKVICKSRFLGQWGYPCEFFQTLHRHTPWQAEHFGWRNPAVHGCLRHTPWQAEHFGWRNPAVHGCLRGENPLDKLVFDFYSLKKK